MYRDTRVAVVIPCYNEESLVARAIRSVPTFVDRVFVVDDASDDGTFAAASSVQRAHVDVLRHTENAGVGAAIATGYRAALRRDDADVIAVMAGDGQMDPQDLPRLLDAIIDHDVDYAKGNRFLDPSIWRDMPKQRILGNALLSMLTRLSSGYRQLFDSQCGYTAITAPAARHLSHFFPRYGYPNDVLARLNSAGARVRDVRVRAIYGEEKSGIRLRTLVYPIAWIVAWSGICRLARNVVGRQKRHAVSERWRRSAS